MFAGDVLHMAVQSVKAHRVRSTLTAVGIGVGIATVMLLTSIGQGINRFVVDEFTQFGTHLIAINPGKVQTMGMSAGVISSTRPLTLDDNQALTRISGAVAVVPGIFGNGPVAFSGRSRNTYINGVDQNMPQVWKFNIAAGRFLPPDDPQSARALAVLGSKLKTELFGSRPALGEKVRIGGSSFRVIGVMEPKGQVLGFDMDDGVYIPAARALELFNREGLMEIDVLYRSGANEEQVVAAIRDMLISRHGREDFTIITQNQMLDVLGRILGVLTLAVGALGGISLLVGSVGILTIMTIAVNERVGEVGLLRALGATRTRVSALFLGEALLLAAAGGMAGLLVGTLGAQLLGLIVPALPVTVPWGYAALALGLSAAIGLAAGVLPARKAAALDPVEALRTE